MKSTLALFLVINSFPLYFSSDPNGYIAFCPCMGRFGNQADHFLGALGFAKGINRTLILPPWVEYKFGAPRSIQVPFDTYFQVEPLKKYHRVILMEEFMKDLAPTIWPLDQRVSFCYSTRGSSNGCNAKEGNPFGPFWDTFGIDFVSSQFYGPLHYDVHHSDVAFKWRQAYPVNEFPGETFLRIYRQSYYTDLMSKFLMEEALKTHALADKTFSLKNLGLTSLSHAQYLAKIDVLDLTGNRLQRALPSLAHAVSCTELILDDNNLSSLDDLPVLPKVNKISLKNNDLGSNFEAVCRTKLPSLKDLLY